MQALRILPADAHCEYFGQKLRGLASKQHGISGREAGGANAAKCLPPQLKFELWRTKYLEPSRRCTKLRDGLAPETAAVGRH
jgi:hypothetical protein